MLLSTASCAAAGPTLSWRARGGFVFCCLVCLVQSLNFPDRSNKDLFFARVLCWKPCQRLGGLSRAGPARVRQQLGFPLLLPDGGISSAPLTPEDSSAHALVPPCEEHSVRRVGFEGPFLKPLFGKVLRRLSSEWPCPGFSFSFAYRHEVRLPFTSKRGGSNCIILYYIVLYDIVLYDIVLYYIV